MKYRKLRFAWSVAWGVVAVLLCVLWVRSYSQSDTLEAPSPLSSCGAMFDSLDGRMRLLILDDESSKWDWSKYSEDSESAQNWLQGQITIGEEHGEISRLRYVYYLDFQVLRRPRLLRIHCPHWTAVLLYACLSFVPWLPFRFSLRTLLIATTLIAVGLGAVVYTANN